MRPYMVIVLIALLIAGVSVYYQCRQNRQRETHIEQNQTTAVTLPASIHQPKATNEACNSYDAGKDCLYRLYLVATIAGAFLALGGLYIIWKQTKATEDAARASKQTADTLVNVERPWIHVIVSQPDERVPAHLLFEMINKGKTPAQIISRTVKRDRRQTCDDMPVPPNYGQFEEIEIVGLLPPNEPRRIASFTIAGEPKGPEVQEHWPHIFYGIVRYKNVISDTLPPHETRFCYSYVYNSNASWVQPWACGPEEYNRHT